MLKRAAKCLFASAAAGGRTRAMAVSSRLSSSSSTEEDAKSKKIGLVGMGNVG